MPDSSIIMRIKELYNDLPKQEARVADLILREPRRSALLTISDLGDELGISASTVFQFCRRLGYSGYRDFRNDLLLEQTTPQISIHEDIESADSSITIAKKVFSSSISSLQDTCALIDEAALEEAAQLIINCNCLSFFGVGGSNVVAYDAYHKFLRSPISCQYSTDYHIQLMQASLMQANDCAVVISHTGLKRDSLELIREAKRAGASVIVITSYPSAKLRDMADVVLVSVAQETGYRSESLSSRIAQLAIIDSLFTIAMFNDEKRANESLEKIRGVINRTKEIES